MKYDNCLERRDARDLTERMRSATERTGIEQARNADLRFIHPRGSSKTTNPGLNQPMILDFQDGPEFVELLQPVHYLV